MLDAALRRLVATAEGVASQVESHAKRIDDTLAEVGDRVATKTDDLIFQLEALADSGNAWAESLLDVVHQVEEGTVDAGKAVHALGDGVIVLDGQLRTVRDVLLDVLPTTGQVQQQILDLKRELKDQGAGIDELIRRLGQQHNVYAQQFARLVEAFRQGRATLDAVLKMAQQLQRVLPGSETGALAELLADAARQGDLP